jgi:hypothetical protein
MMIATWTAWKQFLATIHIRSINDPSGSDSESRSAAHSPLTRHIEGSSSSSSGSNNHSVLIGNGHQTRVKLDSSSMTMSPPSTSASSSSHHSSSSLAKSVDKPLVSYSSLSP